MIKKYIQIILVLIVLFISNTIYSPSNSNKMEQSEIAKNENRIQAILTIDTDNLPDNFQEIIKYEQEVVAQWKAEGILESLFLRKGRNGAILIFKGVDEEKVKELMMTLPLYKLKKTVEYYNLMKQF
jgi:hypothetical protein